MTRRRFRWLVAILLAVAGASTSPAISRAQPIADALSSNRDSHRTLEELSARQRVGQLFLVAHFAAGDEPLADVRRLIVDHGIGGVVLQSGNNVYKNDGDPDLPSIISEHVETLQRIALENGSGVPLFVAVDQEGDGAPFTHLRSGFTALPSAMAIGATWRREDAEAIGRIVGEELGAVGVNVLLGPVLDVLAEPRVDTGGDIGTRAFGGHPFWVAQLGSAYVRGVHLGGDWRVMTVAKHFPGHGGSDRLPDQEVATVVKDLAALSTIELPPFGAVTESSPGDRDFGAVSEALMPSHIRYAGLQGNIQRRTGPISFDREGLNAVLNLEPFAFEEWRVGGGLIVSDSLGVPAVRRWFSPMGEPLANRRIARDALMAGNDVLTIAQFADVPAWSQQMANIVDTLDYFERQYRKDTAFAARVDDAVRRILARKRVLMPEWSIDGIAADPSIDELPPGGEVSRAIVDGVARRAVTTWRISSRPPGRGDRIVVITPREPGRGEGGQLAALSFGPPYLIDSTNYSGLDAYISAYTKIPPAIEAAIGVLFGDLEAPGHSPVTVEEAGYRLSDRLQPLPGSRFPMVVLPPLPPVGAQVPTTIEFEIGPVVDMNGNPVPDRSVVEIVSEPADAIGGKPPLIAQTIGGVARIEINMIRGGDVTVVASMGDGAHAEERIELRLAPSPPAQVSGSNSIEPATAIDPRGTMGRALGGGSDSLVDNSSTAIQSRLDRLDLLLSALAILLTTVASTGFSSRKLGPFVTVRTGLTSSAIGLGAYVCYALLVLVGTINRTGLGPLDGVVVGVLGALAGLFLGLLWVRRERFTAKSSAPAPQS